MKHWVPVVVLMTCSVVACAGLRSRGASATSEHQWLMMVRTVNTDPGREAEFNDWYDHIDVPDVLKVPGYRRARRGRTVAADLSAPAIPAAEADHYIALYNIESTAIDKTIIDMLMATWKMITLGRNTDLLKVVERAYYRQYAASYSPPNLRPRNGKHFLFAERFDLAPDGDNERLNAWYNRAYQSAATGFPGVVRVTRYELYRVLMFEPKYAPRYLTLYEIDVESPEAAGRLAGALMRERGEGRARFGYVEGRSSLYLEINDAQRDAPRATPEA